MRQSSYQYVMPAMLTMSGGILIVGGILAPQFDETFTLIILGVLVGFAGVGSLIGTYLDSRKEGTRDSGSNRGEFGKSDR